MSKSPGYMSQACFPSPAQQHPRAELGWEMEKKGNGLPEALLLGSNGCTRVSVRKTKAGA